MKRRVSERKILLIDGPASVYLISGKAEILGAEIKSGMKVVVRRGKRMPFEALSECEAEVCISEGGSYIETNTPAIPSSWRAAVQKILSEKDIKSILILGGIDSGKTSFSVYLANVALRKGWKISILDCDLGQSDLGPPGTIGLSFVNKPFTDLFTLFPDESIFVGITSPSEVTDEVIKAAAKLKNVAFSNGKYLLITNTDGWVEGEDAVEYKVKLIEALNPDYIVAIQASGELEPIISSVEERKVILVKPPEKTRRRDKETRRFLRGFAYKKHLKGSRTRIFPLKWIQVEGSINLSGQVTEHLKERVEEILGEEILYCEEKSECLLIVTEKDTCLDVERLRMTEAEIGKKIIALQKGNEKGILVSLEDKDGKMLGIGTIESIDFRNEVIKIRTPVNKPVSRIKLGRIRLDSKGNEKEILPRL
ncbi:hypothetical protein CW706_00925 [Candidatus Bathyarchaeota archaeon]|nr:MAG: hypothetical protein CW706_00925 [Candidatus Bathyarchaeota archaeon]